MANVLVLGISGNVSQGILKALRRSHLPCKIIGACVNIHKVGDLWCDAVFQSPYAREKAFIPWLIASCNREQIDIVLTGVEENLLAISANMEELKTSCKSVFVVSEHAKLKVAQDKLLTCRWLEEQGFPFPPYAESKDIDAVMHLADTYAFPLIAKPRYGKGSAGLRMIHSRAEIDSCSALKDYVVQAYIGNWDSEYTVGCYRDKQGKVTTPIVLRRQLQDGSTWTAEVVKNTQIEQTCQAICRAFAPMGPMNIQLRLDRQEKPVPFELNVRFSGTTPMRAAFGFCDVEAALREYVYHSDITDCFSIKHGRAYRYINEAYVWPSEAGERIAVDRTLER